MASPVTSQYSETYYLLQMVLGMLERLKVINLGLRIVNHG